MAWKEAGKYHFGRKWAFYNQKMVRNIFYGALSCHNSKTKALDFGKISLTLKQEVNDFKLR
uniref:Uncharacterized protein n=1 Tax=Romanomermis culicivorax TaxID=13658 RepID=A0A915JR89_ROMCU